jgi:hypothetical protein
MAGDALCRILSFFRIFGLFLSSNILICISIDRSVLLNNVEDQEPILSTVFYATLLSRYTNRWPMSALRVSINHQRVGISRAWILRARIGLGSLLAGVLFSEIGLGVRPVGPTQNSRQARSRVWAFGIFSKILEPEVRARAWAQAIPTNERGQAKLICFSEWMSEILLSHARKTFEPCRIYLLLTRENKRRYFAEKLEFGDIQREILRLKLVDRSQST